MSWRVVLTAEARRNLRKLDSVARRRVQAALEILSVNPRPPSATQLVGGSGRWRARTGDYRIVYRIRDEELVILVIAVGHRREIYRGG